MSNRDAWRRWFAAAALALPLAIHAQPAPPALAASAPVSRETFKNEEDTSTATEIRNYNRSMAVLKAQLAELELRAKVSAKQKELAASRGEAAASPLASSAGAPSVVSVAGLKGNLEAVLIFPSGITQRVKQGDVIGDQKVTTISLNEVVLSDLRGKNQRRLAFGTTAPVRESPTGVAGMPMPPGPGGMPLPGVR